MCVDDLTLYSVSTNDIKCVNR